MIRKIKRKIKRKIVIFLVNHIYVGTKFFEQKRKLLVSIGYEIGEGTKIVGPIFNTGSLKIGKECWIGKNLIINGNGSVSIGDNCDVAPEVTFLTGGHEIGTSGRRAGKGQTYSIEVGNGTWIGARSTILGDRKIGDSVVIATCACVVNDVESNSLVGGVPAKLIRKLDENNE